jgi:hypothetical protein
VVVVQDVLIARNSAFNYKGTDVDLKEVAKALGVDAILTGRVTQRGENLAKSVELVNGSDKTQICGEQYTRRFASGAGGDFPRDRRQPAAATERRPAAPTRQAFDRESPPHILYAGPGENDQAFQSLERAYDAHDVQLQYLNADPHFDSLRSDPRFADLIRRMRLPE